MDTMRPRRLTEFIEILWRRKRLLILMAAPMLIATFFVMRKIPNVYESRSLLVVNLRTDEQNEKESARFSALQQELTSRVTLATLLRKHKLYPQIKNPEDGMATLHRAIKVETKNRDYFPNTPESMSISFRYTDPNTARNVVADLVGIFERANDQVKVDAGVDAERLSTQIIEVEDQLKQLGPQRDPDQLRLEYLARARTDPTTNRTQHQALVSAIETLRNREFAIGRQIADQHREIAEQEKRVKAASSAPRVPGSAAYGQLLSEKSQIEAEIKYNSGELKEKHPTMIKLRGRLAEIDRQIASLTDALEPSSSATTSQEARDLRQMQRELTNLERELDVVRDDISRKNDAVGRIPMGGASPPEFASPSNTASRTEYDRLLSRYNWLRDKQDALLKISGGRGTAGLMAQVIDAPNLPQLPVAPNRMFLKMLALGLAVGFGLLVAFAVEAPRWFMINDDRDVEYYLGAPVLALIPETLTPLERSRRRKLRLTRGLIILAFAAALVPAFIFILNRLQIFQMFGNR